MAALPERPFRAAKSAATVEEGRVVAADVEGRAVVAGHDDERVLIEPEFDELVHDATDVAVPAGDHRRVAGSRVVAGEVARAAGVGGIVPTEVEILLQRIGRHLQRKVRYRRPVHQKHRIVGVLLDPRRASHRP